MTGPQTITEVGTNTDHKRAIGRTARELENHSPEDILQWAVEQYSPGLVMACSFGMQSVAMIDMLARRDLLDQIEVYYIDTGVLFEQTHETRRLVERRYGFEAVRVSSELSWEDQQKEYGGHLYERGKEGINTCCRIRKVEPQRRYLADKSAWISGMRRSHSKTRAHLPVVLWDEANHAVKVNPVAALSDENIWSYIKAHHVPYNPLYDQGYPSIGCNTPICTRRVKPGADPRSGRWGGVKGECGIHLDGNVVRSVG